MILKKWSELPDNLKNDDVKVYYNILIKKKLYMIIKRMLDIFLSCILLIVLSPVFLILSIVIKFDSKGPVIYKQERVTQYGKIFKILKFRTMIANADQTGELITIKNDARITRTGKFLRKYRLDEIPQLLNVLCGDMTFVGTRPEVQKYVARYTDEMRATLLLPAGVTSLASIKYKDEDKLISESIKQNNNIDDLYVSLILPSKMKYNLEALKSFSFIKDLRIIFNTIFEVFK